jgi:hypothetical protein
VVLAVTAAHTRCREVHRQCSRLLRAVESSSQQVGLHLSAVLPSCWSERLQLDVMFWLLLLLLLCSIQSQH